MLILLYVRWNVQQLLSENQGRRYGSNKMINLQALTMKYECFTCFWPTLQPWFRIAEICQMGANPGMANPGPSAWQARNLTPQELFCGMKNGDIFSLYLSVFISGVECSPLPSVSQGQYTALQDTPVPLSAARLQCDEGYVASTEDLLVCRRPGWTGPSGRCQST